MFRNLSLFLALFLPSVSWANSESTEPLLLNLTHHWIGFTAIGIFALAYLFAMTEEITHLNKSKPMVLSASLIWAFIAAIYVAGGMGEESGKAFRACLEGYCELFLFIMVSMAYLNSMEDRGVFDNLRVWLLSKGFSYRKLFWITGIMSFFMSSICNNLTTALLMGAVILAVGKDNQKFTSLAAINVVVATNAGGSYSPFGDITTLLVWQSGVVSFIDFFSLFIPAVINFAVPAAIMHFSIPHEQPASAGKMPSLKRGGTTMIMLFLLTIVTAVLFENLLDLPPAAGMLMGLTYLKFYSYYMQKRPDTSRQNQSDYAYVYKFYQLDIPQKYQNQTFNVFKNVAQLEWDTLLFFYGVMISVGGLSFIGYLTMASDVLYGEMNPSVANILVGIFSAFIDNGTIMFSVLTMHPDISQGQWLLVTLTAGVGGSLLAIGSAAGVGLMGQMKGVYTFSSHLKWMPVILLGYIASIAVHFFLNQHYF